LTDMGRGATFYDCLVQVELSSQSSKPLTPLPPDQGRRSGTSTGPGMG